jgi:hypothetical protein
MANVRGVIYPFKREILDRVLNQNRNIITKFTTHDPSKSNIYLEEGNLVYFYQTKSNKEVVGEGTISKIEFKNYHELLNNFPEQFFITKDELKNYVRGRFDKKMLIIHLQDIKRYRRPIRLKNYITMAGLKVTKDNKEDIFGGD